MPRCLPALAALALVPTLAAQAPDERFSFVATLGVDTVAVEDFTRVGRIAEVLVTTRSPRTTLQRHRIEVDAQTALVALTMETLDPASGAVVRSIRWTRDGDSLRIEDQQGDRVTSRAMVAEPSVLPFIDLVHWPFELILRRLRNVGLGITAAPMLSGTRVSDFGIAFLGADSATVTHPTRGVMRLSVRPDGGIATLDAGATTRALIVQRGSGAEVTALARDFAARDAAGRGMGELSGRGAGEFHVHGTQLTLDYGTPMKRGREIWGALVKYDSLWRTGANRATHVTFSTPVRFGSLDVPAGEYTLYTILTASGGTLIINRQTGQNGQQYDAARDLGRVPLVRRALDTEVETFTIRADPDGGGGILRLMWDRAEYVARFTTRAP